MTLPDWKSYLAMVQHEVPAAPTPTPTPPISGDDMPIMGPASGSVEQAVNWFDKKIANDNGYTRYDITTIVQSYQSLGDMVGLDWFLALAQMGHETGHLSSWWSARPRRNPAGIGVTGATRNGTPDAPPGRGWCWDDREGGKWREGWAFPTWDGHSVPAHLGRLLAYTMRDEQANPIQLALINYALSYRPLPANLRGVAPTITGLNGGCAGHHLRPDHRQVGAAYAWRIVSIRPSRITCRIARVQTALTPYCAPTNCCSINRVRIA
jgi:hypothetical protein